MQQTNKENYLGNISLLFTPVSITLLIDTEDACFGLNASRPPIAKGDLKWRDALLVAHRVNSNNISATVRNRCDWKEMNEKEAMDGGGSCGGLAVILVGVGSGNVKTRQTKKDKQENTQIVSGVQIVTEDGKKYYDFQDVKENNYRARLQDQVPRNSYDFSNLALDEETGYLSYKDTKGKVSAKKGIDVSEFQGETIDWQQVKESGIEFVIVRLGYRAYGESGALVEDAMFEQNVQGALDAGLEVGVYFFSQAISATEAVEETDFVLEHIQPYQIKGPVVYDTEEIKDDTARTGQNTREDFTNFCKVFCDGVKQAGYQPMIYANMKWMAFTLKMEELTEYDFWYADYHELPQCPYDYKMWQYSEAGTVPGIRASVDLDLWFQEEN